MSKAVLVVHTQPSEPSREDEYNKWYDETHLPEVCEIPGIVSGRRFKVSDQQVGGAPPDPAVPGYLAIYEVDSDDLKGVLDQLVSRFSDGTFHFSDALGMDPTPTTTLYELH
ncbi:MAG TPA: hypothetical protein VGH66_13415 [Acidimicrobiales bacterium]|jgi:hypothetical protein